MTKNESNKIQTTTPKGTGMGPRSADEVLLKETVVIGPT
jgi:hypothetical protein